MELAGNPEMEPIKKFFSELVEAFSSYKSEFLSIIETELSEKTDTYLSRLKDEADSLSSMTASDVLTYLQPRGQVMTRDTVAVGQGNQTPPHIKAAADVFALNHALGITRKLRDLTQQAGSHLSRKSHRKRMDNIVGTNIFIGHGSSHAWRDLKDFINERLGLPWDEFNRVPIAGVTNIARLSEMLDSAAFSFLVMTGEDEQKDGKLHARMNVAHEAGLFQGRLGFMRAIILLEDGCEEFSNIEGLGQIRFPKGNIKAVFEEVRRVLEREEIISPD